MNVLYLEDDIAYVELITAILEKAGHRVHAVGNGHHAIRHLENSIVDLLIIDWQVPGLSGFEVLKWTRERIGGRLPILFMTHRAREDEIFSAINAGADDYMIKPINHFELLARANALLRRAYHGGGVSLDTIEIGGYRIDTKARTVLLHGTQVRLTPREFDLAVQLFRNLGRIMPRDALILSLWGRDMAGVSRSLDTHIYRLRIKLALQPSNGVRLSTVYTLGYRLETT
ncbi:response regulator transcription factor [Burkholderia stabilis]|uniref:DNA-binding response regulator n=1 Tax=Burkholderia stabilis TaxID=95485 RepID=A0AAJ5NH55_9BURK|nr:response regulator transcription factor [Burkholderia stabilis]VBB15145.1 Sensory transduction protein regX3,DNA-binding response regulator CreB,Response regulator of citrate/malate metabolism,phosphate regulon transcriptional regulatory protein PhoB,Response regulator receiver domain [Burkholderia stabilis]HDR9586293.1 response regulator transcription factor [Burkholderia stabilis]HDR9589543.1 response regulator transcription factor [Burkholderia stabilis]HDR9651023.1 response regulator tra